MTHHNPVPREVPTLPASLVSGTIPNDMDLRSRSAEFAHDLVTRSPYQPHLRGVLTLLMFVASCTNSAPHPNATNTTEPSAVGTQQAALQSAGAPNATQIPVVGSSTALQDGDPPPNPVTVGSKSPLAPTSAPTEEISWISHPTLPFSITSTEVTVHQFKSCVYAGKCGPEHRKPCNFGMEGRENHPMNCVSYYGADQFCAFAKARICTESEWLAACSGPDGRAFPYGNEFNTSTCNHQSNTSSAPTTPKDTAPAKSFGQCEGGLPGLFDMAGNVTEWVNGCKDDYCKFRGGGFVNNDPVERFTGCSGVCSGNKKGFMSPMIGIRCCRDTTSGP